MAVVLDGNKLAREIRSKVEEGVERLKARGTDVGLAILLVGDNPASKQYFSATLKTSKKVGINAYEYKLPATVSINEIINVIHSINNDERIHGLLILFPLPRRINGRRVVNALLPEKDIDGLGSISVGRLAAEESAFQLFNQEQDIANSFSPSITGFLPCTPFGVIRLLEYYNIALKGKHVVVLGKSLAVGKPLAMMLLAKEATVTVCHRETADLTFFTKNADIICSATGVRGLIKGDMVKKGAVIVDIGIVVLPDGSVTGDVDFNSVEEKASYITPVPGGVGPVTIAMLIENTLKSAQKHEWIKSPFMF